MKLLKLLPLLLMFVFFNSNAHAANDCDEIKGNIVGKIFCKATSSRSGSTDMNTSSATTETSTEKKKWKFWRDLSGRKEKKISGFRKT